MRKLKIKRSLIVTSVLALMLNVFSVTAVGAKTFVQPFEKVASTHMYLDDISEYLVYLNNRLFMDYIFFLNTGDSSFVSERTDIINGMEKCFKAIADMINCSGDVLFSIEKVQDELKESMSILDSVKDETNIDVDKVEKLKEIIAKIDEIDDVISENIEPASIDGNINIMLLGSIAFEVRKIQQVNISSVFSTNIDEEFTKVKESTEKVLARIVDSIENKSKTEEEKVLKKTVYDQLENMLNQCENMIDYVSEMALTDNLNSQEYESFLENYKKIHEIIRNEIQVAVFT